MKLSIGLLLLALGLLLLAALAFPVRPPQPATLPALSAESSIYSMPAPLEPVDPVMVRCTLPIGAVIMVEREEQFPAGRFLLVRAGRCRGWLAATNVTNWP